MVAAWVRRQDRRGGVNKTCVSREARLHEYNRRRQKRTARVAETENDRKPRERKGRRDMSCIGQTASVDLDWSTMSSKGAISGQERRKFGKGTHSDINQRRRISKWVCWGGGWPHSGDITTRLDGVGVSAGGQTFRKPLAGVHAERLLCGSRRPRNMPCLPAEVWAMHVWVQTRGGVR